MSRKMKDSGLEWIGEIPEDWEVLRLKHLGNTKSGLANKKPEDFGQGFPFISYKNIYSNIAIDSSYTDLVESTESDREIYSVKKGDAFFTGSSETIEELGFSSVCLEDIPNATYNGFSIRFRPNSFDEYFPDYYKYYFRSFATRGYLIQNDNSITRANLSQKTLKSLPVVCPSMLQQQKIANFLDEKVAEIDHILDKTRESIEEYKKYKQSIITEAVTKGLNPDVKMKDSGIEWIGEIPEHWEVKQLKYLVSLNTGKTPSTAISKYFDGNVTWYKPGDFNSDLMLNDSQDKLTIDAINDKVIELNPENTVYFVGIGATVGKLGYSSIKAFCNQQVTALVARQINSEFLLYLIQSANTYIQNNALYTTLPIINNSYLGSIKFTVPPVAEQKNIVNFINAKLKGIYSLISQKQQLLLDLEAYKKSLIYECVTGKREVI